MGMSVSGYVWKSSMDFPYVVKATVGNVKSESVGKYPSLEEAIVVAKSYNDGVVLHNISGNILYGQE